MKRALLIVDVQNDFLPTGALPVPHGDEGIAVANALMRRGAAYYDLIVATKDFHPEGHGSFAQVHGLQPGDTVDLFGIQQILWPRHCVENSCGAQFPKSLDSQRINKIIYKGTNPQIDSYSSFFDNQRKQDTGLHKLLQDAGIAALDVMGLATDYCVLYSVVDAISLGYDVTVYAAGCRAIDRQQGDSRRAFDLMKRLGVKVVVEKEEAE